MMPSTSYQQRIFETNFAADQSQMVTRQDLAEIRSRGFMAWAVRINNLPDPMPMTHPMPALLYRCLVGEASRVMNIRLVDATIAERVGRIVLLNATLSCFNRCVLVLCPPQQARYALNNAYYTAFAYCEQPSAWITDKTTSPTFRLEYFESLLANGSGIGFTRCELTYLFIHVRDLLNQLRY